MLELARNYGGGPVLMRTIAENQDISRKYLHALLTSLKSAGMVRSIRGSGGGYMLARAPSAIRVDEVVQVLEGSLCLTDCVADTSTCPRSGECATHELWEEMSRAMQQLLRSVTLEQLVARQAEKSARPAMYHI